MRILLLSDGIPPSELGGAGRIALDTAKGLMKRGHDVTILTTCRGTTRRAPTKTPHPDGIHIRTIPPRAQRFAHYRSVFSRARAEEVMKVVKEVKPDLIHANVIAWQCGYRWIPMATRIGIPVVVTCHDVMAVACGRVRPDEKMIWLKDLRRSGLTWNPLRSCMIRRILNRNATVLCVSDALREFMERHGFQNLRTVHNGIDINFWREHCSQEEARRRLNLPLATPLFLLAGRIGIDKGSALVDRALPDAAVLIVAGSIDETEIPHARGRTHLFRDQSPNQMRLLYAACDAVLVPSLCLDCFPTVCMEAMACARPVIASSWGGAKESVVDGKTGWIIDPQNPEKFRERLQWCCDHRDELRSFGKAGRERVEERFLEGRYLDELMKIYEKARSTPASHAIVNDRNWRTMALLYGIRDQAGRPHQRKASTFHHR